MSADGDYSREVKTRISKTSQTYVPGYLEVISHQHLFRSNVYGAEYWKGPKR